MMWRRGKGNKGGEKRPFIRGALPQQMLRKENEIKLNEKEIIDRLFFISHGPLHTDNSIVALAGALKRL